MFETFAALSTIGFLVVFAVLVQRDRASRREEQQQQNAGENGRPA
jgi:hypothetical protein